jgi:hypothetical protein
VIGNTVALVVVVHRDADGARRGQRVPALSCAFANAIPKESAMPITSPVERISGPRIRSTPWNLLKGKTASLTATYGCEISS